MIAAITGTGETLFNGTTGQGLRPKRVSVATGERTKGTSPARWLRCATIFRRWVHKPDGNAGALASGTDLPDDSP